MQEYLQMVVRNQPQLAAQRLQIGIAQADSRTAAAFPNPSASYSSKPGEKQWGIEQPLPIFGQRRLRMENARKGETAARANVEVAVATTLNDAATAFIDLLMTQQRLKVWQEAQEALNSAGNIVRGQIEAGARSRYDGARLSLQQAQMAMQVSQAQSDWQDAASHAAALAALPQWAPRATGSLQALVQRTKARPQARSSWDLEGFGELPAQYARAMPLRKGVDETPPRIVIGHVAGEAPDAVRWGCRSYDD